MTDLLEQLRRAMYLQLGNQTMKATEHDFEGKHCLK